MYIHICKYMNLCQGAWIHWWTISRTSSSCMNDSGKSSSWSSGFFKEEYLFLEHSEKVWCSKTNKNRLAVRWYRYGVASVSRIDKITGLFCKRALYKRRYSAKETYIFFDPTDRNHPIWYNRHRYSPLHLECHSISYSNLNLFGLFSTEHGKRDLEK